MRILIAAIMILATTFIHASAMFHVINQLKNNDPGKIRQYLRRHPHIKVSLVIVVMFIASVAEAAIWAFAYLGLGAIETLEEAGYFSMVTYTTLGYGDVTLSEEWRILSAFESANGIIMFGWTTAIVLAVVNHVYFGKDLE